jgi:hypothetical protein
VGSVYMCFFCFPSTLLNFEDRGLWVLNIIFLVKLELKLNGVILKLDFKKAYDKVKWSFLQ